MSTQYNECYRFLRKDSFKRLFDFALSMSGIIISIPLWVLFGLLILIEDGWPIFYFQKRVGKNGRIFTALKFRSMIVDAEKEVGPLQAEEVDLRVTKIGSILRSTAMDELPQLINILKGDMSFVGPRALRPKEIETRKSRMENGKLKKEIGNSEIKHISNVSMLNCNEAIPLERIPGYKKRQRVRPGLTGLAQIYLPSDAPREKKFRYDLLYIKKQSFWLDLKLVFLSFWITFRGKWVSREPKI